MASKTGSYLRKTDRQRILSDLQEKGELELASEAIQKEAAEATQKRNRSQHCKIVKQESFGTGCLACGRDDDHANLLLCETCNAEYHTYVLPESPAGQDQVRSNGTYRFKNEGLRPSSIALFRCYHAQFSMWTILCPFANHLYFSWYFGTLYFLTSTIDIVWIHRWGQFPLEIGFAVSSAGRCRQSKASIKSKSILPWSLWGHFFLLYLPLFSHACQTTTIDRLL